MRALARTTRPPMRGILIACALSGACSDGRASRDAGSRLDAALEPRPDGATFDGGSIGDAGAVTAICAYDAPYLVVTRDDALHGRSSAVVRVALQFDGAVSDVTVLRVDERLETTLVRTWAAETLAPPAGFDGRLVPVAGDPSPRVTFLGVADALEAELDVCANERWDRGQGSLEITLSTRETGEVSITCPLGVEFAGRGPEPLRIACAEGIPGWLARPSVSNVREPIVAALMEPELAIVNSGAAPVGSFVADAARVHTHVEPFPFERSCAEPTEYEPAAGIHEIWRGRTSEDVWSGPVAPGTEERANWFWQMAGELLPAGTCIAPDPTPTPEEECVPPVVALDVEGSSSAGRYRFESPLFTCYDP
jgi:hypothetical protein